MDSYVHPSQCFRWKAYACTGGLPWGVCGFGEGQVVCVCVCAFIPHRFHRSPTARKSEKGRGWRIGTISWAYEKWLGRKQCSLSKAGFGWVGAGRRDEKKYRWKRGSSSPCLLSLSLLISEFFLYSHFASSFCPLSLLPIHLFHPIFYLHNLLWTPRYS